ncbi:MAG: thioredoxin domain-containing protein [Epsilonproteobacteria bacterium]|nr:thioredoxin domain-containing protein [Campylobacterota bacterium]
MMKLLLFIFLQINLFALNHLANEPSPYLQQHKNNPVNWYPWGEEAFLKAKKEHKLIFLSIGYSTCHWCHVMMRESFEDKKVADILNRYYISIKVDKEELPHIDQHFQKIYTQFHKRGGGWPLTIILSPDKQPLFSATYIPRYPTYAQPDIITVLETLAHATYTPTPRKKSLHVNSQRSMEDFPKNFIPYIIDTFRSIYDTKHSGFGNRPKFPSASMIKLLLELYQITHNNSTLKMATTTLTTMAHSGLYDQIDGGFFRYCIDPNWEIPHFEKMLYSNAELIELYTMAYILTKDPLYKKVVQESIAMVDKRFFQDGVYMSASNAESINEEGEEKEGAYFLYEYDTTFHYLQKHNIPKKTIYNALEYLHIQENGNFDGEYSHTRITNTPPPQNIKTIKELLQQIRDKREYPFIDYKINTAWNALYINAKLKAASINKRYAQEALYSLEKLLQTNMKNGILYHTSVKGHPLKNEALLEDYAFLIQTLLEAYQRTLKEKYLTQAKELFQKAKRLFYTKEKWYLDKEKTVKASLEDKAYKNPLAALLQCGLYLSSTQDHTLKNLLLETLDPYRSMIIQTPPYYSTALEFYLQTHYGIYIIKSQKSNLLEVSLPKSTYPFIYKFVTKNKNFELCGASQCYISTPHKRELFDKLYTLIRQNN